jgi:hypothetical protein
MKSRSLAVSAACLLALGLFRPAPASAHFILQTPASWRDQDFLGSPQKGPPCGDEGTAAKTGAITAFQTGQEITITINETVTHPGHYRVALAVHDRSELPPEPPVTAGSTACGSVPIMNPPVFPVLADGVLPHTQSFSGPQTFKVTLPAGVTCTHCTLQVIEFMSNHGLNNPGGCFYHHCADISITDVPVMGTGGSGGASAAGGSSATGGASAAGGEGSGAMSGAGGSSSSAGGSGTGTGTGGSAPSTGGTAGTASSGVGGNGTAGTDAAADGSSSSGGCSLASPPSGSMASLFGIAMAAWIARRRRVAGRRAAA